MPAIYTRTGDKGDTGLFGGSRVPKQSARVEAYGTVDEANALIGHAKAALTDEALRDHLHHLQQRLFTLSAELASDPDGAARLDGMVDDADVAALEGLIDECLAETGPPRHFVVPGRDEASSRLHVARTAVRRAERRVLTAAETGAVRPQVVRYLNRLSDALYALARVCEERHIRRVVEREVRAAVSRALAPGTGAGGPPSRGDIARLDLQTATGLAEAAQAMAEQMRVPVVISIVDAAGQPVLLHRMEGALLGSLALAGDKAFTAAAFRAPTHEMTGRAKEAGDLYGLSGSSSGRICVFGGGFPLFIGDQIAGGLGISGGTVEEDMRIARHALASTHELHQGEE